MKKNFIYSFTGWPHPEQNMSSGSRDLPQLLHFNSCCTLFPHFEQNAASGANLFPHFVQNATSPCGSLLTGCCWEGF